MAYFFRCTANPKAPLLKVEHYWEMKEMLGHPDYVRVDEDGLPIVDAEAESAPNRIPLQAGGRRK